MTIQFENHPCFNVKARHAHGRIHLPVAPRCNVQCNFCNRKFDCVNESRPGVSSTLLSPSQAHMYVHKVIKNHKNISVVGIAGPGDPFANPDETMETLRLIRKSFPEMLLCVATNGLNILPYIKELAELNVSHVTITINAVNAEINEKIYSWMRYNRRIQTMEEGSKLLLANQLKAIKTLKEHNILVKINTIIIPGINDYHVVEVAKKVSELGADIFNPMPLYKNKNSKFAHIEEPSHDLIQTIRRDTSKYMPQMHHCSRCRADAVGLLGENLTHEDIQLLEQSAQSNNYNEETQKTIKNIAVASYEGVLINQHLGEADELYIYSIDNKKIKHLETRTTPDRGGGVNRWEALSKTISDCTHLIVSGIGNNPQEILKNFGIEVLVLEGLIEEALHCLTQNKDLSHLYKRTKTVCGTECSGTANGCG